MHDTLLDAAIARGIISTEQARLIGNLAREMSRSEPPADMPVDDEKLRFISGFGDIFVTIGLALFLGSIAYFLGRAFGSLTTAGVVAALAWGLAEYFTRVRRMALPSIILLIVLAASSFVAFAVALGVRGEAENRAWFFPLHDLLGSGRPLPLSLAALLTAALVALHYLRFRVPITVAVWAASMAGTAIALVDAFAPGFVGAHFPIVVLACGLAIFALAMRFDLSDRSRQTRRTDIAFWLHLLAAPLIVHPLVSGIVAQRGVADMGASLSVLAVFLCLGLVAVLVDRRAILVSGLAYAGLAFGTIMRNAGLVDQTVPATLLTLGAFVLLLSAGWRPLRGVLLKALPLWVATRLPHPMASS